MTLSSRLCMAPNTPPHPLHAHQGARDPEHYVDCRVRGAGPEGPHQRRHRAPLLTATIPLVPCNIRLPLKIKAGCKTIVHTAAHVQGDEVFPTWCQPVATPVLHKHDVSTRAKASSGLPCK